MRIRWHGMAIARRGTHDTAPQANRNAGQRRTGQRQRSRMRPPPFFTGGRETARLPEASALRPPESTRNFRRRTKEALGIDGQTTAARAVSSKAAVRSHARSGKRGSGGRPTGPRGQRRRTREPTRQAKRTEKTRGEAQTNPRVRRAARRSWRRSHHSPSRAKKKKAERRGGVEEPACARQPDFAGSTRAIFPHGQKKLATGNIEKPSRPQSKGHLVWGGASPGRPGKATKCTLSFLPMKSRVAK